MSRQNYGDGTIYETIEKHKRKKIKANICKICAECKNKCNREEFKKCNKCKDCKDEALKYCDRFYCKKVWIAQIYENGKRLTVGRAKTKREAIEKKQIAESKIITNSYIKKNNVRLLEIIKRLDNEKLKLGTIKETTMNRSKYIYRKIEESILNEKTIQNLTYVDIENFLNIQRIYSQSELEKIINKLNEGFNQAVLDSIIAYPNNPMLRVKIPVSFKEVKEVSAFSLEEEIKLLEFLVTEEIIIKTSNSVYDNNTIRNLIIIDLLTGLRIGELGAINYTTDIDLSKKEIKIKSTLTKDINGQIVLGTETKTGRYKRKKRKKDSNCIPFSMIDEDIVEYILKEQIKIAKSNKKNKNNLLFCDNEGNPIRHSSITSFLKRICRKLKIKLELENGCHIHMCRHSFVTRLIEFGYDLLVIKSFTGHTTIKQIEDTYGHVLEEFKTKQTNSPGNHYKKEDLITKELKEKILMLYE